MQTTPLTTPAPFVLSLGQSRMTKVWSPRTFSWPEFVERMKGAVRTSETSEEYAAMTRDQKSDIKDVGGYVAAELRDGVRKKATMTARTLITLDFDDNARSTPDRAKVLGFLGLLHTTHSSTADEPRYRYVIPVSRPMTMDEYLAISKDVSKGFEGVDPTCHDPVHLFFWPSVSRDADYCCEEIPGRLLDVDEYMESLTAVDILREGDGPVAGELPAVAIMPPKTGDLPDPRDKEGMIGAFCRAFSVEQAISRFLPHVYTPGKMRGRYTFAGGSSSDGLMVVDGGTYAWTFHGTDPSGGHCRNAFDLVRLHLFGGMDIGSAEPAQRLPSYKAMEAMCAGLPEVCMQAVPAFREMPEDAPEEGAEEQEEQEAAADEEPTKEKKGKKKTERKAPREWGLRYSKGQIEPSISNILKILENDPRIDKADLKRNIFTGKDEVHGESPWMRQPGVLWSNKDDAGLRYFLDEHYNVNGKEKAADALTVYLERRCYNPLFDYFEGLQWDGTPRAARSIIMALGAEDSELNRALTELWLVAAVARGAYRPGIKFDYCPVLMGEEGKYKSTYGHVLATIDGIDYFSDSIGSIENKDAMDAVQGKLVIEFGEMQALTRSEVNVVKSFITKQDDQYRPAYGRVTETKLRTCVFFGTTNEHDYNRGTTGNRRMPCIVIDQNLRQIDGNPREWLETNRDQIWAEAVMLWKTKYQGERGLALSDELEGESRASADRHNSDLNDPAIESCINALDDVLPYGWDRKGIAERRTWYQGGCALEDQPDKPRNVVCVRELLEEVIGVGITHPRFKVYARSLAKRLDELKEWERCRDKNGNTTNKKFKIYGAQKAWIRKVEDDGL